jgi:hypothetical protein
MRQRLRYIIVRAVHIFIFLVKQSAMPESKVSRISYTGEHAIQPIQHLLPYSGHTCIEFGILLHIEALSGDNSVPGCQGTQACDLRLCKARISAGGKRGPVTRPITIAVIELLKFPFFARPSRSRNEFDKASLEGLVCFVRNRWGW